MSSELCATRVGLSSKEAKMVLRCFTSVKVSTVNSVYLSNLSSLASDPAGIISVDEGTLRGKRSSSRNQPHANGYSFHFLKSLIKSVI